MKLKSFLFVAVLAAPLAHAESVTYSQQIQPLWQARCAACHGSTSVYWGQWQQNKYAYKKQNKGPRMDSYAELLHFIGWPQTGSLMRQLDDGQSNGKGKPGGMYQHLGNDEAERQANLQLFKAWVGEDAWSGKHWQPKKDQPAISKQELERLKLAY